MKFKKILSLVIALAIAMSMAVMPMTANAATEYYNEDFENTTSEEWAAKYLSNSRIDGQVTYAWGGQFTTLSDGNNVLLKSGGDAYWFDSTPQTGTYKLKFDIMPAAVTAAANTTVYRMDIIARWVEDENISFATDANGNVNKMKFYEQTVTIDPTKWVTVEVIRDFSTNEVTTKATQGDIVLEGTDTGSTNKMKASMDVNGSGFTGVYFDNITVEDYVEKTENVIYTEANGWTVGADAKEQNTSLIIGKENSKFTPTLTSGKKYEITFDVDVPDTIVGGSWSKAAQISLYDGDTTNENVMSYYLSGSWMNGLKSTTYGDQGDGTMKVTIDTENGVWSIDAPGDGDLLGGTFTAPVTNFAIGLHCEQWIDPAAYPVSISNVRVEEVSKNVIYTAANGWTVGADAKEQNTSLIIGKENSKFTPTLTSGKKYEITFDVDVPDTIVGGSWSKAAQISLYDGDTTNENVMSYYLSGSWMDGLKSTTYGDQGDGTMKVTIDTEGGVWSIDAPGDGDLLGGTFTAPVTNFAIGLHCEQWIDPAAYPVSISNVRVEEVRKNVVYTVANGWTVNSAIEQEDGTLQINNAHDTAAIFKPTLDAGKKYSIKYDVSDLAVEDGSWTFPFRVKMTAGGVETDGILAYRMANVWEARSLAIASGEGSNEIIIDTKNNTWEAYALGSLSTYGTVESFEDFALSFYTWGGPSASISNVTVEEIPFDGTYYEQNFNQIDAAFSNWRAATVNEIRATQPLNVWSGSFETTGEDKHLLSGSMDIYPLAVTPRTAKYELNFDIKPNAPTFANGSNWEAIVMQWSLGSSNSDSWHDMKLGTSAGKDQTGEVNIDRLWVFGQEMIIDPTEWINVKVVYDCVQETINATATQSGVSVTGTAGFTNDASSLKGSPKVIFEALTVNDVKYSGVYFDNVAIKAKGEDSAPVLSADSIKLYANDEEQIASSASAFTNTIKVNFGQEMWSEDMTDENIYVVDSRGNKVAGEVEYEYANGVFTIVYEDGFTAGDTYTVKVDIVRNIGGVATLQAYEKSFKVVDGIFANLVSITQDGKNITELLQLSAGNAKINVNYSSSEDDTPVLHIITAYYKAGALVLAEYFDKTPDENTKTIKYELDYVVKDVDGGYDEVQFMIWDGFDRLKPLSAPITLK